MCLSCSYCLHGYSHKFLSHYWLNIFCRFANWMYTGGLVNFTAIPEIMNDTFGDNAEWHLQDSGAFVEEVSDDYLLAFCV